MALLTNMPQGYGVKGKKQEIPVSATDQVYKGEFVQLVPEYVPCGDELRWGYEDVHILTVKELSQGRVGVVFSQFGETKFKLLSYTPDGIELGNTLVILEEELESATLVELKTGTAVVAYKSEGACVAAVISLEGRMSSLDYTDIWYYEPLDNIVLCVVSERVMVGGGMKANGEAWLRPIRVGEASLTNCDEVRVDLGNDTDAYAGGWSLIRASGNAVVLAAPRALDRPVALAIVDVSEGSRYDLPSCTVRLVTTGKYASSLPTIAQVPLEDGRWALAYGIGWLSPGGNVVKSTVAIEVWSLTRYAAELLWYGCEDIRYAAAVGGVAIESNGVGAAVSYTGEGEGRCIYLSTLQGVAAGPAAPMGPNEGFCRVVPVTNHAALLVVQRKGNGYVQSLQSDVRAIPAQGGVNDGLAISGGGPGETITIVR